MIDRMRVFAVRGAIDIEANNSEAILDGTQTLLIELMNANQITQVDLISAVFTVTNDLDAAFPAAAARELGLDSLPLLCAREIPVPNSLPRVIRVLLHYNAPDEHQPKPTYLGKAKSLRQDLM